MLDEVQLLGEFESILNSLIRMKNVDVYVIGSNARFLSKDVITEFRGRGDEVLSLRTLEIKSDVRRLFVYREFFHGYNKHDI